MPLITRENPIHPRRTRGRALIAAALGAALLAAPAA